MRSRAAPAGLRRHRYRAGGLAAAESDAASAASIRGVVLNAGPAPERKQIPINIDQYVCGKSRESDDLIVGANRGIRWAVVSLQTPPPGAASGAVVQARRRWTSSSASTCRGWWSCRSEERWSF